jgi:hypothetical protein
MLHTHRHTRRLALLVTVAFTAALVLGGSGQFRAQDEVIFVGAGDIGTCFSEGDDLTADLLDNIPGLIFALGDTVQGQGTAQEFEECYHPTWGRHRERTRPIPGNHEYAQPGAEPYFAYFGDLAGPPGLGYYNFDYGAWHIIAMNSMLPAGPGSAQAEWLRAVLADNPRDCTLIYWHHPRFGSGAGGLTGRMNYAFEIAYEAGVDVLLSGDMHHYERFAPMNPRGQIEPDRGIRQFVVGTGGGGLTRLAERWRATEARQANVWGVLKLTLRPGSYSWEFIPVIEGAFTDSGTASCVNP